MSTKQIIGSGERVIRDYQKGSFIAEPEKRRRHHTIISVDDHLVEPPDAFEGRLEKRFADRAPRVIELGDGAEAWHWEGVSYAQIAIGAVAGRPKEQWGFEATRYSDTRAGCYTPRERIKDMDIDGVYASLNFPSLIAGLAGGLFYKGTKDAELGQAMVRAWNDWLYEEWAQPYPERIIPCGLVWLGDPTVAAQEIRRNADRGFKAITFPNSPADMALPSLYTRHWDPIFQACVETDTAICLHAGSDNWNGQPPGSPFEVAAILFPMCAYRSAADWLWSTIPSRFPTLKLVLSEGGISWVPMLQDRLAYVMDHTAAATGEGWNDQTFHPLEVLDRNFFYCAIDFSSGMHERDRIGIDNIMVESDYPHADSSWPDTQPLLAKALEGVPAADARKIAWANASRVFRHPVPVELQT